MLHNFPSWHRRIVEIMKTAEQIKVDYKIFDKPGNFDGNPEVWAPWKFKLETHLGVWTASSRHYLKSWR